MKILIVILGFINGGFMFVDGWYVILNGKYIGPDKPGPWAVIFNKLSVDVFSLGPLFIAFGLLWFLFLFAFGTNQVWAYPSGLAVPILTYGICQLEQSFNYYSDTSVS